MAAKFKFLFFYFLSWVVFFDLMRILFLLYHADKTSGLTGSVIAGTFWYGLRMDLSVAAYILLPVVLFVMLSLVVHFFRRLLIYKIYTFIILLLISLICLSDLELYNAWGFRIDSTPLKFLTTPKEALASVSHLPLLWILVFFILCYALFYFLFSVLLKRIFFQQQNRMKAVTAIALLVLAALLFIPIRGGLQQAPLNQSSVYFSTIPYANHAAINAPWNFIHSVFGKDMATKNPYVYMDAARERELVKGLYGFDLIAQSGAGSREADSGGLATAQANAPGREQWVNPDGPKPLNVIVVVWESFTEKAIHLAVAGKEITPGFNAYKKEGIFFSNCYASGDRTNKGIPAIFSGYPAMPNTTIIHSPNKSAKINSLPQLFRAQNYSAPFFYGGETEFANIKSYLVHSGFDPIIGKSDFASADMNSKWGAHDGVVMNRVLRDLDKTPEPFFAGWLTLSSHEPFEVPVPAVIPGKDVSSMFLNSLHYTDEVLANFIDSCKQRSWWDHTLIVIVGDHGHPLPETGKRSDDFRTPMLWTGGAVTQRGLVITRPVSQLDIATTLVHQVSPHDKKRPLPATPGAKSMYDGLVNRQGTLPMFPFSKDLAESSHNPWAFFCFNNGFGFVDSTGTLVFDNVGKQVIMKEGNPGAAQLDAGKALMHFYFEDFRNK